MLSHQNQHILSDKGQSYDVHTSYYDVLFLSWLNISSIVNNKSVIVLSK